MSDQYYTSAQNQSDLQASVNRVIADHAASRPVNTVKQYCRKQEEFKQWCTSVRGFDDGYLVTEKKLVLYLKEFVIPRGNQRKRKGDGTPVPLGKEAVEAYAKAVIDLYKLQQSLEINPHPHPRGKALKAFFEVQQRGETKRKRDQYVDRGIGTVLDGYNIPDMCALSTYWLNVGTGTALRDRVDFLLGHALLARGESKRFIEFPDLLSLELLDEGPQHCHPLVVIMNKGKTNQTGRIEYGAALRHKDNLLCPVGAVAFYLFWRWKKTVSKI